MDEFMEMPTPCDCGNWFDLNDGFPSRKQNRTICEDCYDKEVEIEDLKEEIEDLENWISDRENVRENKKLLKKAKDKLQKLENS